jgi:Flp pilus assembly protein CpaB
VGAAATVLGAWVFAALYLSAGDRRDVLVLSHDVSRLEVVDRSDLRVVRIASDSDVESLAADRVDDFVGRIAVVDFVSGSLLAEGQLLPDGRELLGAGEAVVGELESAVARRVEERVSAEELVDAVAERTGGDRVDAPAEPLARDQKVGRDAPALARPDPSGPSQPGLESRSSSIANAKPTWPW